MKIIKQLFNGRPGILSLPDDYLTGDYMALLVYTAGAGEHPDNPSVSTVDLLYNNNGAITRARDGLLNAVLDPNTGKSYRFAVLALQGRSTIPAQPNEIMPILSQQIYPFYKIDLARQFKTGLSAGGKLTIDSIGFAGNPFVAGVEMSTPGFLTPDWKSNLKAKLWAFHGTSDTNEPTDIAHSIDAVNQINAVHKGWAFFQPYAAGHGGWGVHYDPSTRYSLPGYAKPLSIYEWMLSTVSEPAQLFTASGTEKLPGTTPPPMATITKAVAKVNITGNVATLIASGSTLNGGSGSFGWDVVPPAGAAKPVFDGNRNDGGSDLADKTARGIVTGPYKFTLTVWDKFGGKDTTTISVDGSGSMLPPVVDPPVVNPPVTPAKMLLHTIKVYSDGSIEAV
jgi:hypothetical protein